MRSPLENEAGVPEDEENNKGSRSGEYEAGGAEQPCNALEKERQAKNENGSERNKVAVSKRGCAIPIGVAGNQVKEGGGGGRKVRGEDSCSPRNENKTDDRKQKDRGPSQNTVLGRQKDGILMRRTPVPAQFAIGSKTEESTENDVARDERGHKTENHGQQVAEVCGEQRGRFAKFLRFPGVPIVHERLDQWKDQEDTIGEINVEHQPGNQAQKNPLEKRA